MRVPQLIFAIGISLATAPGVSTLTQSGTTQGTRGRPDVVQRELQRRLESEAIEQALAARTTHRSVKDEHAMIAQIRDDYFQIQVADDHLRTALVASDFRVVSKSAAEIARRSQRLKENLRLPKPEKQSDQLAMERQSEIGQLSLKLKQAIDSFVENPVFEKFGVIDAQLSAKAGRDLEQIITTSTQLKKSSERWDRVRR